jgi:hypothetical protein
MQFDRYAITLLILRPDAPRLADGALSARKMSTCRTSLTSTRRDMCSSPDPCSVRPTGHFGV